MLKFVTFLPSLRKIDFFPTSRVQIKSAQTKIGCIPELIFFAKSACTDFGGFDLTIDAFGQTITDSLTE